MEYKDFPNNKYKNWYVNLIESRQTQYKVEFETEAHHIYPVSIFGQNKLTVNLTHKEHFIAHLLLWKMYKSEFGDNYILTKKMVFAVRSFDTLKGRNPDSQIVPKLNSNLFSIIREQFRRDMAESSKEMWADSEMREHLTNCRKDFWGKEENRQTQSEARLNWFSDEDNYNKQVEINKEITSRPEWKKQRSKKQKEFSADAEYTKIRIDAMSTPESRAKSIESRRKLIESLSDEERKAMFSRVISEEQRLNSSKDKTGRKDYVNLSTLIKKTSKTPIDGYVLWDTLTKEQKKLFPKKPYNSDVNTGKKRISNGNGFKMHDPKLPLPDGYTYLKLSY